VVCGRRTGLNAAHFIVISFASVPTSLNLSVTLVADRGAEEGGATSTADPKLPGALALACPSGIVNWA